MTLQAGSRLGPYEIIAPIGAGGMGEVYRGRDTRLGRTVALKILPPQFANDRTFKIRLEREAKAISALNHPHICTLYDVGDDYLVMEYCEGQTLADQIARGALPFEQVIDYGVQIAEALEKAHRSGIVHRDLKPGNVMVTSTGIKLLDFGLAKQFSETSSTIERATKAGHVVGTPLYMAPEVLGGRDADARSDIYALGLVLYEMATGKRAATSSDPVPNRALERVIRGCLAKDPEQRTQSAQDVAMQLRWTREGRRAPSVRSAAVAVAIAIAIALGGAWWAWKRSTSPPAAPIRSLVVLPFDNLLTANDEYLVDAMQDGVIGELSQLSGMRLISRTSALHFKNAKKTIPEIARELNVDGVIEGSVVKADRNLRIRVELVRAGPKEETVWSKMYERTRADASTVQVDIVRGLAQAMGIALTPEQTARLARSRNLDPRLYEAYAKGMFHVRKLTPDEAQKGLGYLKQLVAGDPQNASAHSALALAYSILTHGPAATEKDFELARSQAAQAIALDNPLAEAHAALGALALYHDWDWAVAERELKRALQLDPNLAEAHRDYGWFLELRGPSTASIDQLRRAKELDPLTPLYSSDLGWMYLRNRRPLEALPQFRAASELDPDQGVMGAVVAFAEAARYDQAIARAKAIREEWPAKHFVLAYAYGRSGRRDEAKREIAEGMRHMTPLHPWWLAYAYASIGDREDAIRWIEKGINERVTFMLWAKDTPALQPLHGDPRFDAQIRRLHLPG